MNYIVNDIENLMILDQIGVFDIISNKCNSISITNIRINDFSIQMQRRINNLVSKGMTIVEVDINFYVFHKENKNLFLEIGDGDCSSLYLATQTANTIITNSSIISKTAKKIDVETLNIEDYMRLFINDIKMIGYFNNFKIA